MKTKNIIEKILHASRITIRKFITLTTKKYLHQ